MAPMAGRTHMTSLTTGESTFLILQVLCSLRLPRRVCSHLQRLWVEAVADQTVPAVVHDRVMEPNGVHLGALNAAGLEQCLVHAMLPTLSNVS